MTYESRVISVVVAPVGEAIFSQLATTITIDDEAGGEFVEISQCNDNNSGKIRISPEEWPTIRAAIDNLITSCRGDDV